jgi:hypothetical protein
MPKEVNVDSRYRNIKTGNIYTVIAIARACWDIYQWLIIYRRENDVYVWVRSLTEFNEKFELV